MDTLNDDNENDDIMHAKVKDEVNVQEVVVHCVVTAEEVVVIKW